MKSKKTTYTVCVDATVNEFHSLKEARSFYEDSIIVFKTVVLSKIKWYYHGNSSVGKIIHLETFIRKNSVNV